MEQPALPDYQNVLKKYWGYDSFRGIQKEIIESILLGKDTLGLMPTGGGKSLTFQIPALLKEGVCLVITPLIALMKDQVAHLHKKGIKAEAIYSEQNKDEVLRILENAIFGAVKILYISPERLTSESFRTKLKHMSISFICVDEAHCISQWGYDFRPSYLKIADIRKDFPHISVLALTATATPEVVNDIQEKLNFHEKCVFRMSFERKNLAYIVRYATDKEDQLIHILKNTNGSAIVYARSRQRTKELSELLNHAGLNSTYFHAGLDGADKDQRQKDWQNDKIRIIVATNAFGMGIDKADVRIVIHIDCPSSIEAYFQEAGRAGRDGNKAHAILLYNRNDFNKMHKRISDSFPDKDYIRKVYDSLAYFYQIGVGSGYNAIFEFPIDKFCYTYGYFPIQVDAALKILDRAGYIEYDDEKDNQARVMFILERDELYMLKRTSPDEERVITALLRNYSGLFNNYSYIDEAFIAQQTGLDKPNVYLILRNLATQHIISFIPQKKIPHIRYKQRREDSQYIQIPANVYEDLRERMSGRIEAMIKYVTTDNQCRSRQLLRYFGETYSKDCDQCDVCLSRTRSDDYIPLLEDAKQKILDMLNDEKPHFIKELYNISIPIDITEKALRALILEERVFHQDAYLYKKH
jgi:ATP-dependent DNA helicase RecQ